MQELFSQPILGNLPTRWLIALAVATGTFVAIWLVKRGLVSRLAKTAGHTKTRADDVLASVLDGTKPSTALVLALSAGARTLELDAEAKLWLSRVIVLALAFQLGLWLSAAIKLILTTRSDREGTRPGARTFDAAAAFVTNLVVWGTLTLVVLSNFGIEVTALVAGLGIGGLAAALAVQSTLGDLFAALSIYTDRPFDLGDSVALDDYQGTVERIGWRSTHLRGVGGEAIVIANSDLVRSRLRNFRRMTQRRVVVHFSVEYGVPASKLAWIPGFVKQTVDAMKDLRFDHSHLVRYGESGLEFETVFFVLTPDGGVFMDRQQELLLALYDRFEKEKIPFALPSRALHVRGERSALGLA